MAEAHFWLVLRLEKTAEKVIAEKLWSYAAYGIQLSCLRAQVTRTDEATIIFYPNLP